jgi:hypothetical protein
MGFRDDEVQIKIDLSHGPATSRKKVYQSITADLLELNEKYQGQAKIRLNVGAIRSDNSGDSDG